MSEPPLIDVQNVTVRFPRRRALASLLRPPPTFRAVAEADLAIPRRTVTALVGESGSGKTTLGRTLLRLHEPAEGAILFDGQDITHLRDGPLLPTRRRMALVFQDPLSSFNPRHTIQTALATPLHITHAPDVSTRVATALHQVRLPAEAAARYPHELSGGQLQRAALARALMLSPAFIVADEAVSKLDVSVRSQILNLLKDLQSTTSVSFLFITHDLHVARFIADEVAVMFFGRIIETAPAATLFRTPRHPYTQALLATLKPDSPAPQRAPVDPDAPGCIYQAQCPRRLPCCLERHPATTQEAPAHRLACYNPG